METYEIPDEAVALVAETLAGHVVTQELPLYSREFTSACSTCGPIEDSPKSVSTHPAEMVMLALGITEPSYTRG